MIGLDTQVHCSGRSELQIEFGMRLIDRVGGDVGGDGGKLLGYLYFGREEGVAE